MCTHTITPPWITSAHVTWHAHAREHVCPHLGILQLQGCLHGGHGGHGRLLGPGFRHGRRSRPGLRCFWASHGATRSCCPTAQGTERALGLLHGRHGGYGGLLGLGRASSRGRLGARRCRCSCLGWHGRLGGRKGRCCRSSSQASEQAAACCGACRTKGPKHASRGCWLTKSRPSTKYGGLGGSRGCGRGCGRLGRVSACAHIGKRACQDMYV